MKKILFLITLVAATTLSQGAKAQSLDALMKSISSFFSTEETTKPEPTKQTHPTQDKLMGRWIYDSLAIDYTGDSSVAALAVSTLETQLPALAAKLELTSGQDNLMVNEDGTMIITIKQSKNSAYCSNYDERTGSATLMFRLKDKNISIGATVIDHNGKVKLMFNANEMMELIANNYDKYNEMTTLQMAKGVIDSYPGILVGVILKR